MLDFGLAKAYAADPDDANLSNSPTLLSMAATNAGVILGIAAYMSPEQAKGMKVDRRTDIFAFGAVLYEMLTGRQAFPGETVSDILASVLKVEPDWSPLPNDTPPIIRNLLDRCLRKDRARRLQTATDARAELEEARAATDISLPVVWPAPSRTHERLWMTVAGLLVIAVAALGFVHWPETAPMQQSL